MSLQDGYLTQDMEGESPSVDLYTYHGTSRLIGSFVIALVMHSES